jgi:putative pyrroloquinoline-quinone binding quinoprotein/Kelch motif protein
VRRRRRLYPLALLGAIAIFALRGVPVSGTPGATARHPAAQRQVLVADLAPWRLPAPVSAAAVTSFGGRIVVAGGLDAGDASSRIYAELDAASGRLLSRGSLPDPTHDAAAAVAGGRPLIFGGGQLAPTATAQRIDGSGASIAGSLPAARADLAAVTLGGRAYLLGGYDGSTRDTGVLQTADGSHFTTVAQLPSGVRYAAAAGLGSTLYVFGGQRGGSATAAIQAVNVHSGQARMVGSLPLPLERASAFVLGGRVFIAGGRSGTGLNASVWRFDPSTGSVRPAGRLPFGVADAGVAVVGKTAFLVGGDAPQPLDSAFRLRLVNRRVVPPARGRLGPRGRATGYPFAGDLLIADRGNDRLLLVDAAKHIHWRYPSPGAPPPPGGFYFPDDAFFIHGGSAILSNEEDNHTLVQIAFPSGRLLWSYGHARVPGSSPGYLNQPDDAYLLGSGEIAVADAKNCRIEILGSNGAPNSQIGTTGRCVHDPPHSLGYPNGDTPLADGNLLISEIFGSYIDEITLQGRLVWSVHLPLTYPSDPQQLGPDTYLVADYARPGGIYEFNREGQILWSYHPSSGPGMLDHPSLAEQLPTGLIAVNDDYRHRVVIINPKTGAIVWQYGRTDMRGTGPDRLNTPDGFDLLVNGRTPTHPYTG